MGSGLPTICAGVLCYRQDEVGGFGRVHMHEDVIGLVQVERFQCLVLQYRYTIQRLY